MAGSDDPKTEGNAGGQVMEAPSNVEVETGATFELEATGNTTHPPEQGISSLFAIARCQNLSL
jgi:hypothetical protein